MFVLHNKKTKADNAKYQGIIAQWEKKREATCGKLARIVEEEARLEHELKEARDVRAEVGSFFFQSLPFPRLIQRH